MRPTASSVREMVDRCLAGDIPETIDEVLGGFTLTYPYTMDMVYQEYSEPRDDIEAEEWRAIDAMDRIASRTRAVAQRRYERAHMPTLLPSAEGAEMLKGIIRIIKQEQGDLEALLATVSQPDPETT